MTAKYPFIYIATLRGVPTAKLQRLLSRPPKSMIFRDTGLPRGNFNPTPTEQRLLKALGLDLDEMQQMMECDRRRDRIHAFRDAVLPSLSKHITQTGIMEVRNRHAARVIEAFPEARVVVIAREPRDLYLSLLTKEYRRRSVEVRAETEPGRFVEYVNHEFAEHRTLIDHHHAATVRYEDLCLNPSSTDALRRDLNLPATTDHPEEDDRERAANRALGWTKKRCKPLRPNSIGAWMNIDNDVLQATLDSIYDDLPEFVRFWKYERDQPVAAPDPADTTVETFTPFTGSRARAD